jgi:hypothetical protein
MGIPPEKFIDESAQYLSKRAGKGAWIRATLLAGTLTRKVEGGKPYSAKAMKA